MNYTVTNVTGWTQDTFAAAGTLRRVARTKTCQVRVQSSLREEPEAV